MTDMSGQIQARRRDVALWLFALAAMVYVMVVLGGTTRLTESGLSMVSWHPVTGWLPPLTDAAWQRLFAAYKAFPEFQKHNAGMDLAGFKGIFWLEYVHRLWGRLIGVAFALPFLWFLIRRRIGRGLAYGLVGVFVLGAAQGALGWYMVSSGLVDEPSVSQYRLTAHLALAVAIYLILLWRALEAWGTTPHEPSLAPPQVPPRGLTIFTHVIAAWIMLTMASGGFVAGLDAGLSYNTWPLMDGRLVPEGLGMIVPWWANLFENLITVQFDHRLLAETLVVLALAAWVWAMRAGVRGPLRAGYHVLGAVALIQAGLGITTLLLVVPVPVAAAHQAGALALLTTAMWLVHRGRG